MQAKINKTNEEEMLLKLKDEIIRLGLEKTPSRRHIEKLYDRDNILNPQTYTSYFGTWDNVLNRLGLENKRINAAKPVKKQTKPKWEDYPVEYWLEKLIVELCRVGLNKNPSVTELRKVYAKKNIPSPSVFIKYLGSWENVLKRIEKDKRIERRASAYRVTKIKENTDPYDHIFPNGPSKQVLINVMLDEMKSKKLYTKQEYQAKYNIKVLPDMYIFTRATGLQWKDLWKLYVERFGDPIKQEREQYANQSKLNLFLLD